MIAAGTFRDDLYYRLQVIEIRVPPLRDRREEIPAFVEFFLRRYATRYGRTPLRPSDALLDALVAYPWPGNVRELENMMKRFMILQDERLVLAELQRPRPIETPNMAAAATSMEEPAVVAAPPASPPPPPVPVAAAPVASVDNHDSAPKSFRLPDLARAAAISAEREAIQQALDRFRWNRRKTAQQLGVSYKTLLNKTKECGISSPPDLTSEAE